MKEQCVFPFMAVVGQEKAKRALCIAAVNDNAGGLLLIGATGTGKSTLVRGITDIVPDRLVNVPLNATEDMIFGSLDFGAAVRSGEKKYSGGILPRAAGHVVYIDDIHLFRDDLLRGLLEPTAMRCKDSDSYTVVGTVNPEEGTLPPTVFDRFGMSVEMEAEHVPENRVRVMRHVMAFEQNPRGFRHGFADETRKLRCQIENARHILREVEIGQAMLELAAVYGEKANCAGHRAEIFLLEAAKAIAALDGRRYMLPKDIDDAAQFVLPHRMRQSRQETPETEDSPENQESDKQDGDRDNEPQEGEAEDSPENAGPPAESDEENDGGLPDNAEEIDEKMPDTPSDEDGRDGSMDNVAAIDKAFARLKLQVEFAMTPSKVKNGSGKRALTKTDLKQGRYVRAILPKRELTDLAFDATIRAAAPYQRLRPKGVCALRIVSEDLRQKVREKRVGNTFLFVVDASGSMGAKMRMKAVKGTIFTLLQDAYQQRDQVGMIAFRRDAAEIVLPVTRSVDLAQKCLRDLPTGGKTPLAEGLTTTLSMLRALERGKKANLEPIVILLTDGRANRGNGDNPVDNALEAAVKFSDLQVRSVVIDTENEFIKLGIAKKVARAMQASYYSLKQLPEQDVLHIVKSCR